MPGANIVDAVGSISQHHRYLISHRNGSSRSNHFCLGAELPPGSFCFFRQRWTARATVLDLAAAEANKQVCQHWLRARREGFSRGPEGANSIPRSLIGHRPYPSPSDVLRFRFGPCRPGTDGSGHPLSFHRVFHPKRNGSGSGESHSAGRLTTSGTQATRTASHMSLLGGQTPLGYFLSGTVRKVESSGVFSWKRDCQRSQD